MLLTRRTRRQSSQWVVDQQLTTELYFTRNIEKHIIILWGKHTCLSRCFPVLKKQIHRIIFILKLSAGTWLASMMINTSSFTFDTHNVVDIYLLNENRLPSLFAHGVYIPSNTKTDNVDKLGKNYSLDICCFSLFLVW